MCPLISRVEVVPLTAWTFTVERNGHKWKRLQLRRGRSPGRSFRAASPGTRGSPLRSQSQSASFRTFVTPINILDEILFFVKEPFPQTHKATPPNSVLFYKYLQCQQQSQASRKTTACDIPVSPSMYLLIKTKNAWLQNQQHHSSASDLPALSSH